jgi:hypothetical protein
MYSVADAMITKLQQYFEVVHNHPNNWGKLYSLNGVEYPGTIEITLLRKDRCGVKGYAKQFPHPLDAPCAWQLPDVVLPSTFIG